MMNAKSMIALMVSSALLGACINTGDDSGAYPEPFELNFEAIGSCTRGKADDLIGTNILELRDRKFDYPIYIFPDGSPVTLDYRDSRGRFFYDKGGVIIKGGCG